MTLPAPHRRRHTLRKCSSVGRNASARRSRIGAVDCGLLTVIGGLPLVAMGFGSAWMLGWLAAAAVPVAIHLWNRRQYREEAWAAVGFLLAALQHQARRIQLQQLILLAIRTAIIVLVVLAMAEPFLESVGLTATAGKRTHKVIVIDGSYSMAYCPGEISRFSEAKQLAAQLVEQSSQGDGFTLVLMSKPSRVVVGTPAFDPRAFLDEIDNLQLPHTGADLSAALTQVDGILENAQQHHPGLENHQVFFFSDLGRNTWVPDAAGSPQEQQLHEQIQRLAQKATLVVPDLWESRPQNAAITSVTLSEPLAVVHREMTVEAQLRNFGSARLERQLVELLIDGMRVKEQLVDLEPGGQASVSFAYRFELPGLHTLQVRLAQDSLAIDNNRWLSVPVKQHLRVLCIGSQRSSTRELVLALNPDGSDHALVQPTVVPESGLLETDLNQFDCVFLCNISQFTSGEARLLESYLKQGGGVVFFLGDRVIADRYNRELAGEGPSGIRILPAKIGQLVSEAQYQFDPLDYKHPIVSPFRGREQAGLLTTPVYRFFRLVKPETWIASRVALAFAGGEPAIVESPVAQGRSIVVAFPASMDSVDPATKHPWTAFPAWPSFLPIVHELLFAAVGSQSAALNVEVGQPLSGWIDPAALGTSMSMLLPDGERRPIAEADDSDSGPRWNFSTTELSGIYRAEFGPPLDTAEPLAVNVDTAESDLTKADPAELPQPLLVESNWQAMGEPPTATVRHSTGLGKTLLYAALALVFSETFLAWYFGRSMA